MRRGVYRLTEYACWYTALCILIAPAITTHSMENMVMEASFDSRDYAYMNAGNSSFLFVHSHRRSYGAIAIQSMDMGQCIEGKHTTLQVGVGASAIPL